MSDWVSVLSSVFGAAAVVDDEVVVEASVDFESLVCAWCASDWCDVSPVKIVAVVCVSDVSG